MNDHFCAGALFRVEKDRGIYLLGVTDARYPTSAKLPGGTNKNARWESRPQTLEREFAEETGYTADQYSVIHTVQLGEHTKIFYLVERATGSLPIGDVKEMTEPDGQKISVRWWSLEEFSRCVAPAYREAFDKALLERAKTYDDSFKDHLKELALSNSEFYMKNENVILQVS